MLSELCYIKYLTMTGPSIDCNIQLQEQV